MKPTIVGVSGGTGSGKTTIVQQVINSLGSNDIAVIQHDSYYLDRGHLPINERERINYDHPDALETDLLTRHLQDLCSEHPVEIPIYDFVTHTRKGVTRAVFPKKVIIVEGILIFVDAKLRELINIKVFVDTDADTRFIRRLERDTTERGRTVQSVVQQYLGTVKPMHLEFVEPTKQYADIVIPGGGYNSIAVDMLITKVSSLIVSQS